MKRMGLRQFGRIVARVMETLPGEFHRYLDNVVVDVEREPDEATLRKGGLTDDEIADGETIYGLFDPSDLPGGDHFDPESEPLRRLVIFKRPLEDDFLPDRRQLLLEIRKTVVHELAHHFGYSDRDLERFDDTEDPFRDGWVEAILIEEFPDEE